MTPEHNRPIPKPEPTRGLNLQPNSHLEPAQNRIATPGSSNLPAFGRRPAVQPTNANVAAAPKGNLPSRPRTPGFGKAATVGIAIAGVAACLAAGMFLAPKPVMTEQAHPNWKYVAMATERSNSSRETQIVILGADRKPTFATSAGLDQKQHDPATTKNVVAAVQQGSTRDAVKAIIDAQKIPEVTLPKTGEKLERQIATPTITEGFKEELIKGDINFFHLYLYDCCAEDGDVVEVQIDGHPFATVPITHAGATLSIPMTTGRMTAIAVRGIRDGGGGITVAFHSSAGDAFMGTLFVDQIVPLGIVGR